MDRDDDAWQLARELLTALEVRSHEPSDETDSIYVAAMERAAESPMSAARVLDRLCRFALLTLHAWAELGGVEYDDALARAFRLIAENE